MPFKIQKKRHYSHKITQNNRVTVELGVTTVTRVQKEGLHADIPYLIPSL